MNPTTNNQEPLGGDLKDELNEAINDYVRASEDLMTDLPPHGAKKRYAEARATLDATIEAVFASKQAGAAGTRTCTECICDQGQSCHRARDTKLPPLPPVYGGVLDTAGVHKYAQDYALSAIAAVDTGAAGASDTGTWTTGRKLGDGTSDDTPALQALADTGAAGASEVKPWHERTDETTPTAVIMAMEQEIADLRAQLARQRQGSGEPVATVEAGKFANRLQWVSDEAMAQTPVGSKLYLGPAAQADEVRDAALEEAARICWPDKMVWSEDETQELARAEHRAESKGKGHYETLFAVAAISLKRRAAAIRALKRTAADNQKG